MSGSLRPPTLGRSRSRPRRRRLRRLPSPSASSCWSASLGLPCVPTALVVLTVATALLTALAALLATALAALLPTALVALAALLPRPPWLAWLAWPLVALLVALAVLVALVGLPVLVARRALLLGLLLRPLLGPLLTLAAGLAGLLAGPLTLLLRLRRRSRSRFPRGVLGFSVRPLWSRRTALSGAGLAGGPARGLGGLMGLDGVDELGLLHRPSAGDAQPSGQRLEVGQQHLVEPGALGRGLVRRGGRRVSGGVLGVGHCCPSLRRASLRSPLARGRCQRESGR